MSDSNMATKVELKKNDNERKRWSSQMLLVFAHGALAQLVYSWAGGMCETREIFYNQIAKRTANNVDAKHQCRHLLTQ